MTEMELQMYDLKFIILPVLDQNVCAFNLNLVTGLMYRIHKISLKLNEHYESRC